MGRGCYCTFESDLAMGGGKLLFGGGCLIKINLCEGVFQLFSVYFNVQNCRVSRGGGQNIITVPL